MILLYLTGCIIFMFFIGLFSASEIAFVSASILRLRHQSRKSKSAQLALKLILNPERFLVTALVGTNISVVVSSSLATLLLIKLGVANSDFWVTIMFTPFIVIFADLIPKNIGRMHKERFITQIVDFLRVFEFIFWPLVSLLEKINRALINLLIKPERRRSSFSVTKEEIKKIVAEIGNKGVLDRGEKEAIEDVFDFKNTKIKDVIIRLKNVVGIDYTDNKQKIILRARKSHFTRYPVFRDKKVIGYINIFDLFYCGGNWRNYIRPISCVGESQKLNEIFTMLRRKQESMALVMRGKKQLGIVTPTDIIGEIITSIIKD